MNSAAEIRLIALPDFPQGANSCSPAPRTPAHSPMRSRPSSAAAVARRYAGIVDGFVVDQIPPPLDGVTFFGAATLMESPDSRLRLAPIRAESGRDTQGRSGVSTRSVPVAYR
jgi:hypothetical protein